MRCPNFALVFVLLACPLIGGCESEESKKCNAVCDAEAARVEKCDGSGAEACKADIMAIVAECRLECKKLVE